MPKAQPSAPPKLPRLPKGTRIHKRPLLHPPITPTLLSSSVPKTIYLSTSSPFISTVKRVRKYLSAIERRALGDLDLGSTADRDVVTAMGAGGGAGAAAGEGKRGEVVTVKATGRAVEKALRVAVWFQGQADTGVRLGTGTVGAVDDVEGEEGEGEGEGEGESRVRRLPVLEVGVWLK